MCWHSAVDSNAITLFKIAVKTSRMYVKIGYKLDPPDYPFPAPTGIYTLRVVPSFLQLLRTNIIEWRRARKKGIRNNDPVGQPTLRVERKPNFSVDILCRLSVKNNILFSIFSYLDSEMNSK